MKIDRNDLREILEALRPGLNKKERVQQSCHFIFFKDKIATFNERLCIIHPFTCEEEFSVKGEEFFRLINGIAEDTIDLTVIGNKIKVKTKTTNSVITSLSDDQKNVTDEIEILEKSMENWKKLPKKFTEALSLCAFSAAPDLSMGVKSCVCIKGDKAFSTDNFRGSLFELDKELKEEIHIPSKAAIELAKYPITEYCFSGKWACFRTDDGLIFACSTIEGSFPYRMEEFFTELEGLSTIELPAELQQLVNEVVILASNDESNVGKLVSISLENNSLTVKASNELGFVEKTIDVDFEEDPLFIPINSTLLSQILNRSSEMYVGEERLYFVASDFYHCMAKTEIPEKSAKE
jgi:hypothetical protein